MQRWTVFLFVLSLYGSEGYGLAEMISNYAKVSVGNGQNISREAEYTNASSTTPLPVTADLNDADDEETTDYEDFDDFQEATDAKNVVMGFDKNTAFKMINGVVSLLGLLATANGKGSGKSSARLAGKDDFAEDINNLAQDRFHPTTATKKFKLASGAYDSYMPSPADSYSSNGGKTSYDSDSNMYMLHDTTKSKSPMTDYMTQNDPVEIQQSYSYQLPSSTFELKPDDDSSSKMKHSQNYYDQPPSSKPSQNPPKEDNSIFSWMMKPLQKKPNAAVSSSWSNAPEVSENDDNAHRPVFYSWMKSPTKNNAKPMTDDLDLDENDQAYNAPPPDEDPDIVSEPLPPWLSKKPQKKNKAPPPDDSEEDDIPSDTPEYMPPWLSKKPPKKNKPLPPPPEMDTEDDNSAFGPIEDARIKPWGHKGKPTEDLDISPPSSLKNPPSFHSYWSPSDHDIYLDDHHFEHEHEEEEDHHMKDEDRESKRPYTYYHLGRKLWYIPLLFSLYFIVYIGALVLKSIARHKVELPEKLWELHDHDHDHHGRRRYRQINDTTNKVYDGITKMKNKFM